MTFFSPSLQRRKQYLVSGPKTLAQLMVSLSSIFFTVLGESLATGCAGRISTTIYATAG